MKKRIHVTKAQLSEYVERKKAENTVGSILEEMQRNSKNLNEQISLKNANKSVLDKFRQNNKITTRVENSLKEYGILDDNGQII
jgi:hypothetical protein